MKIRLYTLLTLLALNYALAEPIASSGLFEGKLSFSLDSTSESSGMFVHQERLAWGVQGSSSKMNLKYKLDFGGVVQGNSAFSKTNISPEYSLHTSLRPANSIDVSLFSYSRLRNPMQIYSDSLEYRELVNGLKLGGQLWEGSRFSVATGFRTQQINHRDSIETHQQFIQIHLHKRLLGMQIRLSSEMDVWNRDTLENKHSNMTSLQWYGSPMPGLRWTASNVAYQHDGNTAWRLSHQLNYKLSKRQKVWAKYSSGDLAYGSRILARRSYDLRYRFQWKPALGMDIAIQGNKVSVPDSIDIFHWRSYGTSTHWNFGKQEVIRGNLDLGFKESYLYGKGFDMLLRATESKQILRSKWLGLSLRDDLSVEFFQRIDDSDDPRYDIRHKIQLTSNFLPGRRYQLGSHLKMHSHFGSDLDFSPDTLRNAIIEEIFFKSFKQNSQFSVNYRTVLDMQDPDNDLRFYFNTRYFYRMSPSLSSSFMSMYRLQSDIYSDYLWLSATLKFQTDLFSYALELQSSGPPNIALDQDSRILLRFVRRI